MTVGLPVVATTLAAEGMSLEDGENMLAADGSEGLANAIARIYRDETLWRSVSENGLAFAKKAWGAKSAWQTLAEILDSVDIVVQRRNYALTLYRKH